MSGFNLDLTNGDDLWPNGADNSLNDSIRGLDGNDFIDGGNGADTLAGGLGNNTLIGDSGNDWVSYADATGAVTVNLTTRTSSRADGNDSLSGIEAVLGGSGDDSILGGAGGVTTTVLSGGGGNDIIAAGGAAGQWLLGGIGNDLLTGGTNAESVEGGDGDDTLRGLDGNDTLVGGEGNDLANYAGTLTPVTVNLAAGTSSGAQGNDSLVGIENVSTAIAADSLLGDDNANVLSSSSGDDTLNGGAGNDTLIGGLGNDVLDYSAETGNLIVTTSGATLPGGNDSLSSLEVYLGGSGNDSFTGSSLAETFNGGAGQDSVTSGGGQDSLFGGIGNDTLNGGAGNDSLDGGDDKDWVSYANVTGSVTVNLGAIAGYGTSAGADGSDSLTGIENILGGNFNDSILGDASDNTMLGGAGVDNLSGGAGNDWLDFGSSNEAFTRAGADSGNDTLIGGDGQDTLDLGVGWTSGPEATGWINYTRTDGTIIYTREWETVVCFAEGTRIVTPHGEDAVENLRAGDMVLAMRNGQAGFEALRWVGFLDVAVPRNAAMAAKTAPILIKAGALAPGMPARDLRVSPDHAMEVDGHLIPAKHLVNSSSIIQETWCRRVRYFHLELEAHGLLLSEGTWSESYLEDGNRHAFNNAALTGLFLDFEAGRSQGQYDDRACLPVLRQGAKLDEIQGRLALRAEELAGMAKGRRRA